MLYGEEAGAAFLRVLDRLSVPQLLRIRRYLATVNDRRFRTIAPGGDWTRLQVLPNPPERRLGPAWCADIDAGIGSELGRRLSAVVSSATVDPRLDKVTLPTSDGDLLPYGRGTRFPLPEDARFVRTASFWASGPTRANIWYDNGWNFFDAAWRPLGSCCWNHERFREAAVFSGDPTNSKDLEGRACQLIDLDLDALARAGVAHAVWSVLCFSRQSFDAAVEVVGALQWGSEPQAGRLFEPARVQLAFPIRGAHLTKLVAWLDVQARELVFLDANVRVSVRSAAQNGDRLAEVMPAYVEYLGTLPTVRDLFGALPAGPDVVALYSDEGHELAGRRAYVFRPTSEDGDIEPFPLSRLLAPDAAPGVDPE